MTTSERPCPYSICAQTPTNRCSHRARHCTAHRPRSTVCTVGTYVCFPPACLPICSLQEPSPAAALLNRDNRDTNALGQYIRRRSSCPRIYPHISLTNRPSPSLSAPHSSTYQQIPIPRLLDKSPRWVLAVQSCRQPRTWRQKYRPQLDRCLSPWWPPSLVPRLNSRPHEPAVPRHRVNRRCATGQWRGPLARPVPA